jgi:hypothetical protein
LILVSQKTNHHINRQVNNNRKKNYALGYLLTKEEKTVGSPEKPLSVLGAISYQKYWKNTLYRYFSSHSTDKISIQGKCK